MKHALVFAWGPDPKSPRYARLLGAEEVQLERLMEEHTGSFRMNCHAACVPELVALTRSQGRDCTFELWPKNDTREAERRQAILLVGSVW